MSLNFGMSLRAADAWTCSTLAQQGATAASEMALPECTRLTVRNGKVVCANHDERTSW
jgi:hypothetical protein